MKPDNRGERAHDERGPVLASTVRLASAPGARLAAEARAQLAEEGSRLVVARVKMRRKRTRRGPRKSCGYCQTPGPHPCAECQAAVLALRASRGRGAPKVVRRESRAPVEGAHIMALVDEIEPLPLVPHFGYKPRGMSDRLVTRR